jgi:hypothetical protein
LDLVHTFVVGFPNKQLEQMGVCLLTIFVAYRLWQLVHLVAWHFANGGSTSGVTVPPTLEFLESRAESLESRACACGGKSCAS